MTSIDKTQGLPAVLANMRVRRLWLAQVSASTADEFYAIAVVWLMIEALGAGAGWIGACRAAAILLASLGLGAVVHRWPARRAMVVADLGRATMMCSLAVAAFAGWAAPLPTALIVIAIAAMTALFDPALQSVIPTLTENPKHRTAINGLFDSTLRLARILGPGLVALTAGGLPTAIFLLLAALLMVVSAYLVSRSAPTRVDSTPAPAGSALQNLMLGFKLVANERLVVLCFGVSVVNYTTWAVGFMLGLPLLLRERMGEVDALSTYGALIAAYGVGNIFANIALTLRPPPGLSWRFLAGAPFVGAGYVSLAIGPPSLAFMVPILC
jgi:MFS transporter, DHA3 family, macrolide efflux protein